MTSSIPNALAAWSEAPRVRSLNACSVRTDGRYVLCWLQQALRARDNPVIDAAICLANDLGLPMWDPVTGGGFDGLHADRVNQNQGAESTLAAMATMQLARHYTPVPQ